MALVSVTNLKCSLRRVLFFGMAIGLVASDLGTVNATYAFQADEVAPLQQAQVLVDSVAVESKPQDKTDASEKDENVIDTAKLTNKEEKISGQFAQLHLRDGSVIGGEIKTPTIEIKTDYGVLTVPIARVSKIYPGLNSSIELKTQLSKLVENLGAGDVTIRDAAQRDLLEMGSKIKNVIQKFDDGGVAERGKRLSEIQTALDEIAEEMEEEALDPEAPLSYNDTIVTPDFSIVGEIQQKQFEVTSKFGLLNVQLGDIMLADRMISKGRPEVRKKVTVGGMAFFQSKPVTTGIRVQKGDKVSITADGVVQWTNWNNSSTPDGLTNRSSWNGINSGTLVARIGTDNSKCVKVGAKGSFVAKQAGTLYLGIAMRDSYATNSGYTWTGEYKAKVRVNPK